MSMLEWAALGAMMFAVLLYCARIMRHGLTTLDEDRSKFMARISEEKRHLEEDSKHISAEEQLYLMRAALKDFLRLEDCPKGSEVKERGHVIEIRAPGNVWQVELLMRERLLASTKKVLHGRSCWVLRGESVYEVHSELSRLMASLNAHWHGIYSEKAEPDFVARRLAAFRRAQPGRKKNHGAHSFASAGK